MSQNERDDPVTLANIAHAHTLSDGRMFPLSQGSIGALLACRARETPEVPFLTYYDGEGECCGEADYGGFYRYGARRVAALLTSRLGLAAGDRIATLMGSYAETVDIYFGAWLAGITVVPLNVGEDDDRLVFVLNDAQVKAIFIWPDQADRCAAFRDRLPDVHFFLQLHSLSREGFLDYEEQADGLDLSAELPDVPSSAEALIVYTSGTTGQPKGVVLEHGNLLADAQAIADWHDFGPQDRALNVLPLHHVNGIVVTLITPLVSGGSVVLSRRFQASTFWQTLADEHCTWTSVVPTILAFLCERQGPLASNGRHAAESPPASFRHIICGAGPLTTELARRFHETFGVRVVHGYGLSETTCYSCFLPTDLNEADYARWMWKQGYPSLGCPLPVNEMAIHDTDGHPLPSGQRGEIVARGPNVMRGYFGRPDANRTTFAHGWFRSGDEGFYTQGNDGRPYFFITGRLKELIIRGGVNISPFDIDEVLNAIPGVRAAMAVGFPHALYGEEIGAYVQRDNDMLTEHDILQACREHLSAAKSPKVVVFGTEFPVTSTGKYQRNKLRSLFSEWEHADFREGKKHDTQ